MWDSFFIVFQLLPEFASVQKICTQNKTLNSLACVKFLNVSATLAWSWTPNLIWCFIFMSHLIKHANNNEKLLSWRWIMRSRYEMNVFMHVQGQHGSNNFLFSLPTWKIKKKIKSHYFLDKFVYKHLYILTQTCLNKEAFIASLIELHSPTLERWRRVFSSTKKSLPHVHYAVHYTLYEFTQLFSHNQDVTQGQLF